MNNKDKSIYTLTVPCSGEKHRINLTKEGKLKLLNHTDDEIEIELAFGMLGGELPECLKIKKAWENDSYKSDFHSNDPILDYAFSYLKLAFHLFQQHLLNIDF
ncbi:MAG: hypothetical protein PWR08_1635 [Thermoanaerobacterium sp.]|uniref:Uncharacterized protein n=1 Tax=Thermoanaerobacterium butyriciformans TaxID=1702242 RepID=A0ABS4NB76_9THEO|nr:hypothetical protein [Thermoanaerobacterium butyriciformans]MBP2070880.1 hypothetical protein [Thermoanaerobacterium butyriciformans]MDN5317510.1 hypothetical protein [Thermoanaerobacterium sp.]